jgi:hypothetical protein
MVLEFDLLMGRSLLGSGMDEMRMWTAAHTQNEFHRGERNDGLTKESGDEP